MLLAQVQEAGIALSKEQLEILADTGERGNPGLGAYKVTTNAIFQSDGIDLYDSDCDEVPTAQASFRANLLNFGIHFVPQQELSADQYFWLQTSHTNTDQSATLPVKIEAPRELTKYSVDKKFFEIEKKKLKLENKRLLEHIICQDVVNIVMHANVKLDNELAGEKGGNLAGKTGTGTVWEVRVLGFGKIGFIVSFIAENLLLVLAFLVASILVQLLHYMSLKSEAWPDVNRRHLIMRTEVFIEMHYLVLCSSLQLI
nr:hypothetical protein [Tanacetum cinerariifolium]